MSSSEKVSAEKTEGETLADLRCIVVYCDRPQRFNPDGTQTGQVLCVGHVGEPLSSVLFRLDAEGALYQRLRDLVGSRKATVRLKLEIAP